MIALFIAENGPKCINENKNELMECFNVTLQKYIPVESHINSLPHLEMGTEQCKYVNGIYEQYVSRKVDFFS